MYKYIINIYETKAGNQHNVPGYSVFSSLQTAIIKALTEKERMLTDYGEIQIESEKANVDLEWALANAAVFLELQKFNENDNAEPFEAKDFENIDKELMNCFSSDFNTDGWAICSTTFFHYSK